MGKNISIRENIKSTIVESIVREVRMKPIEGSSYATNVTFMLNVS